MQRNPPVIVRKKYAGKWYEMSQWNTLAIVMKYPGSNMKYSGNNMKYWKEMPRQQYEMSQWNSLAIFMKHPGNNMKCQNKMPRQQYEMSERNTLENDMKYPKETPWKMIWNAPTVYEKGPGIKWMKNIGQTNEMPLIKFCGCIHTGRQALACSLW